ncbi:MAG: DUF1349 domain-containing protein [Anaerolineae bacterium]
MSAADTILHEPFDGDSYTPALQWYCEPAVWRIVDSHLVIEPGAKTDYWQKTHYGFSADNGHFLYTPVDRDFVMSTKIRFYPRNQYDQAGLMVRIDAERWIKTSVEYEPDGPSQLGAVVTAHGYSDWSTQAYPRDANEIRLRIQRRGDDYIVDYAPLPDANTGWTQIRVAHLPNPATTAVLCGLYACSPTDKGYRAEFDYLSIKGT